MALNPREKLIAIGVASAVGLYALNAFAIQPYRAALTDVESQIAAQKKKLDQSEYAVARQAKLRPEWDLMGVKVTPAEADTRLSHYLGEWAKDARLTFSSVKPERTPSENKMFAQITTHATTTGHQKDIVRMMWALTNSPIPLKVNEMTVASKKDGTDDLQLTFSVSTLCVDPDAGKPANKGGRTAMAMTNRPAAGRDPS